MLKVQVSPFYSGQGWYDPKSGINFMKRNGVVEIPPGCDITNIERNILRNLLIVVEGSIDEYKQCVQQVAESEKPDAVESAAPEMADSVEQVPDTQPVDASALTDVPEPPKPTSKRKKKV